MKFQLGTIVATSAINDTLSQHMIANLITRHVTGDDGDLPKSDKKMNTNALENGERIFSRYEITTQDGNEVVYVITEWDRSVTTILYDMEY